MQHWFSEGNRWRCAKYDDTIIEEQWVIYLFFFHWSDKIQKVISIAIMIYFVIVWMNKEDKIRYYWAVSVVPLGLSVDFSTLISIDPIFVLEHATDDCVQHTQ